MAVGFVGDDGVNQTIESTIANEVDYARSKLRGKGSDVCLDCGLVIPLGRRKALPSASYCVICQPKHDISSTSYYNRRGSKDSQIR